MSNDLSDLLAKYEQGWYMIASCKVPNNRHGYEILEQVRQVARVSWELEVAARGESEWAKHRIAVLEMLAFLPLEEITVDDFDLLIHPSDLLIERSF